MKLYDEAILELERLLTDCNKSSSVNISADWPCAEKSEIIMRDQMAYELGGGTFDAVSGLAITESRELVPNDEVILIGDDLMNITADRAYARLAVVRVKEGSLGTGEKMYNAIRSIEYVRYHVNPKGFMIRISGANHREPVRIAKEAIDRGMDINAIGTKYLEEYHKNPNVEAVKLIFITEKGFDFRPLKAWATKIEQITKTIDHALRDLKMDCHTCNLKPVCDEIEGMKELHFANRGKA